MAIDILSELFFTMRCHRIMINHNEISDSELRSKIMKKEICLGGNKRLKIFGKLSCKSGKRMKTENRVFFGSDSEAISNGYRPCGHCMNSKYQQWKNGLIYN